MHMHIHRWWYPNGRRYHTPLRKHMKELVNEIIADAIKKGFQTTRKKSGPQHVPGSTLLDPVVAQQQVEWADSKQRCRREGCEYL